MARGGTAGGVRPPDPPVEGRHAATPGVTPMPHKRSPYAGLIPCLRCDRYFYSWDRRQNRLCDPCRYDIDQAPSEEEAYPVVKSRRHPSDD